VHDHRGGPVCGPPPPRCVAWPDRGVGRDGQAGGRTARHAFWARAHGNGTFRAFLLFPGGGVETIRIPRAKGCALPLPSEGNYYYYIIIIIIYTPAHQDKATGKKTRLDIQNYGCNGNLLCCGKKPHFLSAEPWKGVGKGMLSPGCLL